MDKEKIKIDCYLTTRGTREADISALDDLEIPDPDLATGKEIIRKEIKEDVDQGNS